MWTFRQEKSNTVWTWDFKFSSTNIYSRRECPGQSFKGLGSSTTRAPAPVPLGQLLWQPESKSFHLKGKGCGPVCRNSSFPLLKPEADWAGGQSLSYYTILQFNNYPPKQALDTTRQKVLMTMKKMGKAEQKCTSSPWKRQYRKLKAIDFGVRTEFASRLYDLINYLNIIGLHFFI